VPFPEFVYGHRVMTLACLADVLAETVERDVLSEAAARDLARYMLHDNAVELYGLEKGRAEKGTR
jgi:hypothetical protein